MLARANLLIDALFEPEYLIREVHTRGEDEAYEVAKFTRGKQPTAVYRVARVGKRWSCSCPGFKKGRGDPRMHRHIKLVISWLRAGRPDPMTPAYYDWLRTAATKE